MKEIIIKCDICEKEIGKNSEYYTFERVTKEKYDPKQYRWDLCSLECATKVVKK